MDGYDFPATLMWAMAAVISVVYSLRRRRRKTIHN
jgi:hypothetical protein